jgi:hypothetical protein
MDQEELQPKSSELDPNLEAARALVQQIQVMDPFKTNCLQKFSLKNNYLK